MLKTKNLSFIYTRCSYVIRETRFLVRKAKLRKEEVKKKNVCKTYGDTSDEHYN